jgi:histone deacetylase 6
MGYPDPVTSKLEAHNCWLVSVPNIVANRLELTIANICKADAQKDYIGWIISKGYAVIDVNIPKHISQTPVSATQASFRRLPGPRLIIRNIQPTAKYQDEDENRPTATEELANYLWDNYIE